MGNISITRFISTSTYPTSKNSSRNATTGRNSVTTQIFVTTRRLNEPRHPEYKDDAGIQTRVTLRASRARWLPSRPLNPVREWSTLSLLLYFLAWTSQLVPNHHFMSQHQLRLVTLVCHLIYARYSIHMWQYGTCHMKKPISSRRRLRTDLQN